MINVLIILHWRRKWCVHCREREREGGGEHDHEAHFLTKPAKPVFEETSLMSSRAWLQVWYM